MQVSRFLQHSIKGECHSGKLDCVQYQTLLVKSEVNSTQVSSHNCYFKHTYMYVCVDTTQTCIIFSLLLPEAWYCLNTFFTVGDHITSRPACSRELGFIDCWCIRTCTYIHGWMSFSPPFRTILSLSVVYSLGNVLVSISAIPFLRGINMWGTETLHMWKSRVKIENYSVAYFDCIAAFKVPYRWTSVKRGAHKCFVDLLYISCIYGARMSSTLNGSSAIKHFKHSDVNKIRDRITFDFYTGLPHNLCSYVCFDCRSIEPLSVNRKHSFGAT